MVVTAETINEFFVKYGWEYDYDEENNAWHTGFRGKTSNFTVFVHLTENWLIFSVVPYVNAPEDERCQSHLGTYLLRLNCIINMAKFSLDDDGDVMLTVELPTEGLTYAHFFDGLNAVSFYADEHYLPVLNVAQDPEFDPGDPADRVQLATNHQDGQLN